MTKIISSQHYLNWEKVEEKIEEIKTGEITKVIIPYVVCEFDGDTYGIMIDAHHRLAAARELGIAVDFEEVDSIYGYLQGEDMLEAAWMDGDWYFVESSDPSVERYDLVW